MSSYFPKSLDSLYRRGVSNSLEAVILRKREVRLLEAYFRLPYSQHVKKGTRTKFMDVSSLSKVLADVFRLVRKSNIAVNIFKIQ